MSRVTTSINRDAAAYRRGLVLGLTMAEIMLLLVFCLLIASAVIFKRDREVREDLEAQRGVLQSQLTEREASLNEAKAEAKRSSDEAVRLKRLVAESGKSSVAMQRLDDEWRKLIASDEAMEKIRSAGLLPEKVAAAAADIRSMQALLDKGMTGDEIVAAADAAASMEAELAGKADLSDMPPAELARLAALGLQQERSGEGEHDWPPIINLSEAKGYSFAVGRAELSPEFSEQLKSSIADDVVAIIERYDASVVEIIGHTDEQPMAPRPSNLDTNLIHVLKGDASVDALLPGDNAGLGMARAVSVARLLRADPRFADVTVLPLSGGQMILPGDLVTDGSSAGDARDRRRIEIRVRRPEAPAAQ